MNRAELTDAFQADPVTTKLLKAPNEKPTETEPPAMPATPPAPATLATPASDDDEDETASDRPAQNW